LCINIKSLLKISYDKTEGFWEQVETAEAEEVISIFRQYPYCLGEIRAAGFKLSTGYPQ
jgi:hypothetical protein